ncbi:MAG: Rrf2 family transcriptional regulator [Phycisphaerales bacterium]
MYGKSTENAIAAMSRLAEVWDGGSTLLSAADIAENRKLQKPFVSKILSNLAQAGLVQGTRGPGGGFRLSKAPKEISLFDVYLVFERENESLNCPFGGGICGVGQECALHDKLVELQDAKREFLTETTFDKFRVAYQEQGLRPATELGVSAPPRKSLRARETHSSTE